VRSNKMEGKSVALLLERVPATDMWEAEPALLRSLSAATHKTSVSPIASRWVVGAIFCLMFAFPPMGNAEQQRLVLAGATLIDGIDGTPIIDSRIVIVDGRFVCVSGPDGCASSPGDRQFDVSGTWITPGLIDTHAHLDPITDPKKTAAAQALRFALGITTVRDAGSEQLEALLNERKRASDPDLPVPRIVISARPLGLYAEHYGVKLGGELVRHLVELGVDAIKIKDHTTTDLWEQEVRTASELGIPIWGHTFDAIGPPPVSITQAALEAGLDGITHLSWIAPFCQKPGLEVTPQPPGVEIHEWRKGYWLTTDAACIDTLIAEVVRNGVWLEPTLVTEWYWWRQNLEPPHKLAFLRTRPPSLRDILTGHDALAERRPPTFPEPFARMTDFVRRFHEAGGMLIAGTDEVRPGLDLHAEMDLLRGAALTPLESLQAATRNAAIALGRQDLGTIEVGKLADAVIFASDPLDPAGTTLNVREVIKGGIIHESDALLNEFRRRYRENVRDLWVNRALRLLRLCIFLAIVAGIGIWALRRLPQRRRRA